MTATVPPPTDLPDRLARLQALLDDYPEDRRHGFDGGVGQLRIDHQYVLVERNHLYGRGYWLSSHVMPETAAQYHVGQECGEDWEPIKLVDLDAGTVYEPELTLRWTEVVS